MLAFAHKPKTSTSSSNPSTLARSSRLRAPLQRKLTVGAANDPAEREADRVADQVMRMPAADVAPIRGDFATAVRRKCSSCEEESVQRKGGDGAEGGFGAPPPVHDALRSPSRPLDAGTRAFFEPRFGQGFGDVRVHDGSKAGEAAASVQARAFTVGSDIVFAPGEHDPRSERGRHLLAHELTHVVQQRCTDPTVRRELVPDTGFRYTPPKTVTRSIVEIQGVVGAAPDGIYGEETKKAVEKYQQKLKAAGFYTDTIDGKWGDNTESAHIAFAVSATSERRGYNCAGFALKDFVWHDLAPTKAIYAGMTHLADCSKPCNPHEYKFWMWEMDVKTVNTVTGASSAVHRDFHTVSGKTNGKGEGPTQVMSKNGQRPVLGPKPPLDWEPKTGPAEDQITGAPIPNRNWVVTNTQQDCYCSDKLP